MKNVKTAYHYNLRGNKYMVERFVYEQLGKVLRRDDVVGLVTGGDAVKRADFMDATKDMDDFWARMNPGERERLLRLLVRDGTSPSPKWTIDEAAGNCV
ncbi:MAG: hypothetical protein J6P13_04965 [Kiritimatiellae bacterium]|nr:hypothetical protein [Kiritimatiellia bacterium]